MSILLNILWIVVGGWTTAVSWFTCAVIMAITIVGIPWARAAFNIALLNLWPFGSKVMDRKKLTGRSDIGTGFFGFIGNLIWIIFAGWWLALIHLFWALVFAITIIGIPIALQHIKLAKICFAPIGKAIKIDL